MESSIVAATISEFSTIPRTAFPILVAGNYIRPPDIFAETMCELLRI